MNQKGFSLTEVLLSLFLVSSFALSLLKEQQHNRQLLHQFILQAGASQFLDELEEHLMLQKQPLPLPPSHYKLQIKQIRQNLSLELSYFQRKDPIIRHIYRF